MSEIRKNREAQSLYQDGFKHLSTLVIATSLLTAALFRDYISSVYISVFLGFGLSLTLSLWGIYLTTTDYEKNLGVSSFVKTLFRVNSLAFLWGLISLALSPISLMFEGTRELIVITSLTAGALFILGVLIYLNRKLDKTIAKQRKQLRETFDHLEEYGVDTEKIRQKARNDGIDIDEILS